MAETEPSPMPLGARVRDAMSLAPLLHGDQRKKGTLGYDRELAKAFARRTGSPLCRDLDRAVRELEHLSRSGVLA